MLRLNFYLRQDQINSLILLPGNISEHIRRAVDDYVRKNSKAVVSPSKRGDNNGRK